MNLLERIRGSSWQAALLLAALLIAPAACVLMNEHVGVSVAHPHPGPDSATDHDHATDDHSRHCAPHFAHCPEKAIPPAGAVSLTLAALVLAALTVIGRLPAFGEPEVGGIRGPPRPALSSHGRTVLTLHCISRR